MSKELPVNGFKLLDTSETSNKMNEDFVKNYNENNDKGYILEVDVKYPKRLHELHSDLPFLSERMEVNKCKKLYLIRKICSTHKCVKTSVKSWIKVKKNP